MTMRRWLWLEVVVGLLVIVGLPFLGKWVRHTAERHCAYDGARIVPLYQVRVEDDGGLERAFCCIECARLWLQRENTRARTILVTDEVTGRPVAASSAWFVRSRVITMPHTGNRVHAFKSKEDALKHAETASGSLLQGMDRPFGEDAVFGSLSQRKME
jgi:hypothetical protein